MPGRKQRILAGRPAIKPAITFAAKMPRKQEESRVYDYASRSYVAC